MRNEIWRNSKSLESDDGVQPLNADVSVTMSDAAIDQSKVSGTGCRSSQ